MNRIAWIAAAVAMNAVFPVGVVRAQAKPSGGTPTYLGFDRNDYPGDENLKLLRQTFSYAAFWLNRPPGEKANTWVGKRATLQSAGFGFLVLFNGRLVAELKTVSNADKLGKFDGQAAVAAAQHEGFPAGTVVFLDLEEGGRMLPEQKAYIYAWVDEISAAGFRSGIYCSGIANNEGNGVSVVTLQTSARTPLGERSNIGWRMMPARLRRDALSHRFRPSPPIAAWISRKYGNLLNRPRGGRSRRDVRRTMIATEVATRRESITPGACTWT